MRKGEIWIINSEDSSGHEQSGIRPAVVVSDVVAHIIIVVPFTSNARALRFAHTVQFSPTDLNNLSSNSIAMIFQLRAIDVKRLERKIGFLSANEIKSVGLEIKKMLRL